MLDFSPEKMIFIFLLIVIVLGPEKMPEVSRKLGRAMGELRKVSGGFQNEMRQAMRDVTDDTKPPDAAPQEDQELSSGAATGASDKADEPPVS